jgi:hypothetical protein
MARTRNIKPGFFTNDILAEVPPLGRLLFAGLWCHADRAGRLMDRPRKLKAEILPYDDCDIEELLNSLQSHNFILRYEQGTGRYIQILTFGKHQNPHVKEPESEMPAPDKHQTSTRQAEEKPERAGPSSFPCLPSTLTLPPESDTQQSLDMQIHEIAALHPRIHDAFHLPHVVALAIGGSISRDGRDVVWAGTKCMAEKVAQWPASERHYLSPPEKFFNRSEYREDPEYWNRSDNGERLSKREQDFAEARRRCEEAN